MQNAKLLKIPNLLKVCPYSFLQPHIQGVANDGVSYGNFVRPRYGADEITQIVQIQVVAGVEPEPAFPRRFGSFKIRRYGFLPA